GVIGAMFLGFIIRRDVSLKQFYKACVESVMFSGTVLILVGFAATYGWILASEGVPTMMTESILSITVVPILAMLLVMLVLCVVGAVMETIASLVIVLPTLLVLGEAIGVEPIQMTLLVVINLTLGLLTPPIGVGLFIVTSISKESMSSIIKEMIPFFLANTAVLILDMFFPSLTLCLHEIFGVDLI